VYGIVVHTTGGGPATRSAKNAKTGRGCQTAIDCALQYYRHGGGGFPHYVIDFDGKVHATCPEEYIAWHAGWTSKAGGRNRWKNWSPPAWWARIWGANKTPLDLIPPGANSPNSQHLGIELLGAAKGGPYTDAQYTALARLVADIDRRHGLGLDRAPSPRLLGHEDVNPLTGEGGRADTKGGWDPGAHRAQPRFSWTRLWSLVTQARAQREAEEETFVDVADMTREDLEQLQGVGSDAV
jgi:N-acetyl-anhydromuramyl-L-alanine amidase AmpD